MRMTPYDRQGVKKKGAGLTKAKKVTTRTSSKKGTKRKVEKATRRKSVR